MHSDTTLPLTWLPGLPVWVEQWPLSKEKLHTVEALFKEQLDQRHIEYFTSPWNTLIFTIKKKSRKWHLLHDLQEVKKRIQPMDLLAAYLIQIQYPNTIS